LGARWGQPAINGFGEWTGELEVKSEKGKGRKYNVKIKYSKDDPPNKFEGLNKMTTPNGSRGRWVNAG
jgi:hypothetical protein